MLAYRLSGFIFLQELKAEAGLGSEMCPSLALKSTSIDIQGNGSQASLSRGCRAFSIQGPISLALHSFLVTRAALFLGSLPEVQGALAAEAPVLFSLDPQHAQSRAWLPDKGITRWEKLW